MTEPYQLIPKYRRLTVLCNLHQIPLIPEFGEWVFYQGHSYLVIGEKGKEIVMIDEFTKMPFQENDLIMVNSQIEEDLLYIPGIRELLNIIQMKTSFLPSMTPGVQATREVWQLRHPNADPVVAGSLEEALLDLAIQILEQEKVE